MQSKEGLALILKSLAIAAGSYVVGSMSLSILASKALFGGDIREKGSGNAGATNMARVHGWGAGLLTLAWDAAKAAACMLAGKALGGEIGLCLGAGACMLGHCFPVLHNFKGVPVRGGRHRGVLVPVPCEHPTAYPCHLLRVSRHRPPRPQHQAPGRRHRAGLQGRRRKEVSLPPPAARGGKGEDSDARETRDIPSLSDRFSGGRGFMRPL